MSDTVFNFINNHDPITSVQMLEMATGTQLTTSQKEKAESIVTSLQEGASFFDFVKVAKTIPELVDFADAVLEEFC